MKVTFVGFGSHAANLVDICKLRDYEIVGYIDEQVDSDKYVRVDEVTGTAILGFGGVTPEDLEKRYDVLLYNSAHFKIISHPNAIIAESALFGDGVQIMAGAVIQADVQINSAAIINTGAIVEHHSVIEKGVHIAPRATVLGGCVIGEFSFIGAGAVIVQNSVVPPRTFVKANSVWKKS